MSDPNKVPPKPKTQESPSGEQDWDLVDETSWESFPASDSPSWAAPDRKDREPKRSSGGANKSPQ